MRKAGPMGITYLLGLLALLALGGTKRSAKAETTPTKPTSKPTAPSASPPVSSSKLSGHRILIIGDSLSARGYPYKEITNSKDFTGSPGQRLAKKLTQAGAQVWVNAIGGRNINGFAKGSTTATYGKKPNTVAVKEDGPGLLQIQDAIDDHDLTEVLFLLGTNDASGIAVGNPLKYPIGAYKKLIPAVRSEGVRVIGLGPPEFWPDFIYKSKYGVGNLKVANDQLVPAMRDVFGAEDFVDSRPLTAKYVTPKQGRGDYIHFGGKGAEAWADGLFWAFVKKL